MEPITRAKQQGGNIVRVAACSPFSPQATFSEVRLDKNENPFDPPPGFIEELRHSLSSLEFNRYPDQEAEALRSALAVHCGFPAEWISIGNGGDEILLYLIMAFVPDNGCLMTLSPSFSGYEHVSRALGTRTRSVPLCFDGSRVFLDEEKLADAISAASPDLILIDRPNNPTGLSVSTEMLSRVAGLSKGVLAVDEAYVDFCGGSFLSEPEKLPPNVFVLRTFSKAWGLAGLRVGWGVSRPCLRERIEKIRPPYNVSVFSQEAARVALGYSEWMQARVKGIAFTRDRFIEETNRIPGWTALPANGNFVTLYSKGPVDPARAAFEKRGIKVRFPEMGSLSEYSGTWVRVAVGLEEEMNAVLETLKDLSGRL